MRKGWIDMCGRYSLFMDEDIAELREIVRDAEARSQGAAMKAGEIFPTDPAPVLLRAAGTIGADVLRWGFPGFDGRRPIINARAETAKEKKTFRDSLLDRRCVIPSTGFYEWDRSKRKFKFNLPGEHVLYMAGFWNDFSGERRFVILTTEANGSIADVHDRMPLVLPGAEAKRWVTDLQRAMELLQEVPPLLVRAAV